ncbi:MAG: flagellar export chaperone FliS [Lautropia sp.]|nr:flagellar export chaperone FliS [Lautropia sp.]
MFASMHRPSAATYHTVDIESTVHLTDPHHLIEMLFDGAVAAVMKAAIALKQGNLSAKGESTSKAIRIIDEGLKAALDPSVGEISANLAMLYDYMNQSLLQANMNNDLAKYEEVAKMLKDLRETWQEIRPKVSHTRAVA